MEEGDASEVTYNTYFIVSTSGYLAKQTLEEGKQTSEVAAGIIRPQLIQDNHDEKVCEVRYILTETIKVATTGRQMLTRTITQPQLVSNKPHLVLGSLQLVPDSPQPEHFFHSKGTRDSAASISQLVSRGW